MVYTKKSFKWEEFLSTEDFRTERSALKRRSIILIIWAVYIVALILIDAVVPYVDPSAGGVVGFLPFFFFLPIFFPRRYMRNRSNQNSGNSKNTKSDSATPEKGSGYNDIPTANAESFDQYGISYRRRNFNFLYLAGIVIILVAAVIAVYVFLLK